MLVSKKHSTGENTRSLRVAYWNNDGTTQMYGCKNFFEITNALNINICKILYYLYIAYTPFMAASTLLKNMSTDEWMAATTFVKQGNNVLWKKLFPAIKQSNPQGKNVFFRKN